MSKGYRFLTVAVMVICWCGTSWGSAAPKYKPRVQPQIADERMVSGTSAATTFGQPIRSSAASYSPGSQVGNTYYDYQHNGTMGRMVDESNGKIQCTWMKAPGPSLAIRTVNWNARPLTGSAQDTVLANGDTIKIFPLGPEQIAGGQEFSAARPGYSQTRNRVNGKNITLYHDFPEDGGLQFNEAQLDLTAGNGVFNTGTPSSHPLPEEGDHQTDGVVWPKATLTECGGDLIYHTIGHWGGAANEIWYWRGIVNDGAATISWDSLPPDPDYPIFIEPADAFITGTIEAFADTVMIALIKQINAVNADVVLYKSTDCGLTWPAAGAYTQNITNYTDSDPEGVWLELNAAYDSSGEFHVIWNTAPADGQTFPVNLYHWSASTGVRLITSAPWENSCGGGILGTGPNNGAGTNNLAIADPGITIKPAGAGGIPEERIYVVWTQFGPTDTDCSTADDVGTLGGGVNGEIYWSVSTNGGSTWDRPQTITGSESPDCMPGDCVSEGWVTTAAWADSGVYLSWVEDRHSGAIVFNGGAWAESPYMIMAAGARAAVLEPVIAVTPTSYIELNAKPSGGGESVQLSIISVGNDDLTYTVEVVADGEAENHVQVEGAGTHSGGITAGDPPDILTISYDAAGLVDPSEHNWQLRVTSNDPTNDPGQGGSPIFVNLQVFAAEVWWTCQEDTLSTGLHRMQVSACLEMGDAGRIGTGFFDYADSAEWMYSGSPVVTLVKGGGDTTAYHNAFMSLADRTRVLNKSFRAQSDFLVTRDSTLVSASLDTTLTYTADVAQGEAASTDTTIGIDYEIVFPKNPNMAKGMFYKFKMYNRTGSTISGIHYGAAADVDLDDDAGENQGRGNEGDGWIGGIGGTADTLGFTPNNNYIALFHLPLDSLCTRNAAVGAQVLANYAYVHPENAFNTDSLYILFDQIGQLASWGTNVRGDTGDFAWDIAVMLETGYNLSLGTSDTVEWGFGIAVSDVDSADLETNIQEIRQAASPFCLPSGCPMPLDVQGDVNADGVPTAADVITLVNWIFKQQGTPTPCDAAGDVNCDGVPTAADIITEVNFVFKSQLLPCHQCDSPLASEC